RNIGFTYACLGHLGSILTKVDIELFVCLNAVVPRLSARSNQRKQKQINAKKSHKFAHIAQKSHKKITENPLNQ
ncbi:hypothetical protein, partial [Oenococcus oeni]|uniref:hypothetical protein n=1 Tax=Oenococcus oeni TaxID=1247 RepID=UPI001C5A85D8